MVCSARAKDTLQLNLPNPGQEWRCQTNDSIIARAKIGNTASEQDGAFRKEDNAEMSSLYGPRDSDLGFPMNSKRGSSQGLGTVSKKETPPASTVVDNTNQPSKDLFPGPKLSNP
ncbi:Protein ZINC INDUCED FACILITATOR-LIKE 1 [Hordeum vulgare]|nr:Protein ZINC INDUCED FACILITATOR-LIKE 1 [Hordeum vulgare]